MDKAEIIRADRGIGKVYIDNTFITWVIRRPMHLVATTDGLRTPILDRLAR